MPRGRLNECRRVLGILRRVVELLGRHFGRVDSCLSCGSLALLRLRRQLMRLGLKVERRLQRNGRRLLRLLLLRRNLRLGLRLRRKLHKRWLDGRIRLRIIGRCRY
jgi:hypothetical protein